MFPTTHGQSAARTNGWRDSVEASTSVDCQRTALLLREVTTVLATQPSADRMTHLSQQLGQLHGVIEAESNPRGLHGYMESTLHLAPRLSCQAESLRLRRLQLLERLQEIRQSVAERAVPKPSRTATEGWARLQHSFQDFRHELEAVESKEVDLMIEGLYLDIGVGD